MGQWLNLRAHVAHDMPEAHARELFLGTIPDELRIEDARRKELVDLTSTIALVREEVARLNGRRLANVHDERRRAVLGSKHGAFTSAVVPEANLSMNSRMPSPPPSPAPA